MTKVELEEGVIIMMGIDWGTPEGDETVYSDEPAATAAAPLEQA